LNNYSAIARAGGLRPLAEGLAGTHRAVPLHSPTARGAYRIKCSIFITRSAHIGSSRHPHPLLCLIRGDSEQSSPLRRFRATTHPRWDGWSITESRQCANKERRLTTLWIAGMVKRLPVRWHRAMPAAAGWHSPFRAKRRILSDDSSYHCDEATFLPGDCFVAMNRAPSVRRPPASRWRCWSSIHRRVPGCAGDRPGPGSPATAPPSVYSRYSRAGS
jgi:hypothetical protein